jgi:hypothetical protein
LQPEVVEVPAGAACSLTVEVFVIVIFRVFKDLESNEDTFFDVLKRHFFSLGFLLRVRSCLKNSALCLDLEFPAIFRHFKVIISDSIKVEESLDLIKDLISG